MRLRVKQNSLYTSKIVLEIEHRIIPRKTSEFYRSTLTNANLLVVKCRTDTQPLVKNIFENISLYSRCKLNINCYPTTHRINKKNGTYTIATYFYLICYNETSYLIVKVQVMLDKVRFHKFYKICALQSSLYALLFNNSYKVVD